MTRASGEARAAAEPGDLRLRVRFLEEVARALAGVLEEEEILEQTAQLALRHLALACWIFLRDETGAVRLARAVQAGPSEPAPPPGLNQRVKAMLGGSRRKRRRTASAVKLSLLEHDGESLGAVALLPGRTQGAAQQWMSRELAAQAASALAQARSRARLQHAIILRDDVFVALAHELGNSLGALALQVRAMLNESVVRSGASPFAPRLGAMDFQIARLIALNRRMLDSSQLSTGRFPLALSTVDAAEVLREVLARNADELAWRRCAVTLEAPRPEPGAWDRGLLDQIFSNLLSNAMKYGHGRPILLSLQGSAAQLRFRIVDHGIGIAESDHQRIFEKFERAAPIEQGTSLGIGLWLVRRMARAMGGTVHLTSAPGAGSIFTVQLPRKAPARRTPREVPT